MERRFKEEFHRAQEIARDTARNRRHTRRPDGEIRHIGTIPTEVYYALRKKHGKFTDEMARNYLFEHERKGRK
jgi:hypothetical protein